MVWEAGGMVLVERELVCVLLMLARFIFSSSVVLLVELVISLGSGDSGDEMVEAEEGSNISRR